MTSPSDSLERIHQDSQAGWAEVARLNELAFDRLKEGKVDEAALLSRLAAQHAKEVVARFNEEIARWHHRVQNKEI